MYNLKLNKTYLESKISSYSKSILYLIFLPVAIPYMIILEREYLKTFFVNIFTLLILAIFAALVLNEFELIQSYFNQFILNPMINFYLSNQK